ncbi:4'-phosphopantetheinyl transferase family protein [Nafulsella turpanensis]|uniref:4'-phosphopantetheinyl transferase family protein n=1 Tax=Nafulsella turpanensis TaxID=1265690 RepID=UPI000344F04A|nr:4'-phosphopantetheinyl transferase superfamily protein [Nafulsella turpanensis]
MPQILHEKLHEHSSWALWHIEEGIAELQESLQANQPSATELDVIKSEKQKLEWLSSRLLLRQLAKEYKIDYPDVVKDEHGKPFLHNTAAHISLSHSYPYASAIIHTRQPVGIDIEKPRQQLLRIGPRILHPEELSAAGDEVQKLCIYWAAKEALYKCYGRRGLTFQDEIFIEPFLLQQQGQLRGRIHTRAVKEEHTLHYRYHNDLLICFSL